MSGPGLLDEGGVLAVFQHQDELERMRERCASRYLYEQAVAARHRDDQSWTMTGWCQVCGRAAELHVDWLLSDGQSVNFREHLHCPNCGLNNRQRFNATVARKLGRPPFYLYEQVTPFYTWARDNLPQVTGSEYLGFGIPSGTVIDGVRHEDALALSFEDGSLGTIVSNDVFEHVPDIDQALAECDRVLSPDGLLLFSIPFFDTRAETLRRAELRDGELVELLEPQYHGNPVDEKGSLVFYEHGWDILERCRAHGFEDAVAIGYWSLFHGYLGGGLQLMFAVGRGAARPSLLV